MESQLVWKSELITDRHATHPISPEKQAYAPGPGFQAPPITMTESSHTRERKSLHPPIFNAAQEQLWKSGALPSSEAARRQQADHHLQNVETLPSTHTLEAPRSLQPMEQNAQNYTQFFYTATQEALPKSAPKSSDFLMHSVEESEIAWVLSKE